MGGQEDVLVRYLSDSLKMVEQVMRGATTNTSGTTKKPAPGYLTQQGGQHHRANQIAKLDAPARRASSDVIRTTSMRDVSMSKPWPAPPSETQHRIHSTMRASLPQHPGARWPSTGRAMAVETSRTVPRQTAQAQPQAGPSREREPRTTHRASIGDRSRPPASYGKPPLSPQQPSSHQFRPLTSDKLGTRPMQQGPPSEAGTNDGWWSRPGTSSSSVVSYPMTAVTDRGGSIASTEFRAWLDRITQLESAVKDERSKRRQFEEDIRKLHPVGDSLFGVSQGLTTTTGGLSTATAGDTNFRPMRVDNAAAGRPR